MIKFIIVLAAVLLLVFQKPYNGDAMAERPDKENFEDKIDLSDGVNKKEAIIFAKNYIIKKGLEENVVIFKLKVQESRLFKACWSVCFPPSSKIRERIPFNFIVDVDKKTGEIKLAGWDK